MKPLEVIAAKRQHLARLANQQGADGEGRILASMANWTPRPRGSALKVLLAALRKTGVILKGSSFDAIALPDARGVDFDDPQAVEATLPGMTFIEIKSSSQPRVTHDFSGFFFSLTESEIAAADALGSRHRVALYNRTTEQYVLTSVPEILARARSTTWQLSVQL